MLMDRQTILILCLYFANYLTTLSHFIFIIICEEGAIVIPTFKMTSQGLEKLSSFIKII